MATQVQLSKGVTNEVWNELAKKSGHTDPEEQGVIASIATLMDVRKAAVSRWRDLKDSSYPVHRKSTLCKIAKVLGVEAPVTVEVEDKPPVFRMRKGFFSKENSKQTASHNPEVVKNMTSPRFWQDFDLTVETAAMIQNKIEDAMLRSIQLRKKQVIAELKNRMVTLGLTANDLR